MAIILNPESEIHDCLAHVVQGEGAHNPPAQGIFICYMCQGLPQPFN